MVDGENYLRGKYPPPQVAAVNNHSSDSLNKLSEGNDEPLVLNQLIVYCR